MSNIAEVQARQAGRHPQWMRVAVVGLGALLLLAAATDQRNAVIDRSSSASQRIGHRMTVPATEAMINEMLTHD